VGRARVFLRTKLPQKDQKMSFPGIVPQKKMKRKRRKREVRVPQKTQETRFPCIIQQKKRSTTNFIQLNLHLAKFSTTLLRKTCEQALPIPLLQTPLDTSRAPHRTNEARRPRRKTCDQALQISTIDPTPDLDECSP
jgi:hypothetical protein